MDRIQLDIALGGGRPIPSEKMAESVGSGWWPSTSRQRMAGLSVVPFSGRALCLRAHSAGHPCNSGMGLVIQYMVVLKSISPSYLTRPLIYLHRHTFL